MSPARIPAPVLVTGAGGLIGSAICAELSLRGVTTRALLAPSESALNVDGLGGVSTVRGDVRDAREMRRAVESCRTVVHAAALNTLWHKPARDFYSINVRGTRNVLEAALEAGVGLFVLTSSCEVMGRARRDSIFDEETALDLNMVSGHYERSKYLAELTAIEYGRRGLDVAVIRPTAVIGPGDIHLSPPGMLIRAFLEGRVSVYYDAGINVVDSRDVALAHVSALEKQCAGTTFIAGGHNVRLSELFEELSSASGLPAPGTTVAYPTALAAAAFRAATSLITRQHPGITVSGIRTVKYPWHFDISRARRELGLKPRPLAETVRDAVEWHLKAVTRNSETVN